MSPRSVRYYITRQCNAEALVKKKLLGGKDIEAVLQRLDRLTKDEAQETAAQTLEIVYDLFQNMKDVVDGEQLKSPRFMPGVEYSSF